MWKKKNDAHEVIAKSMHVTGTAVPFLPIMMSGQSSFGLSGFTARVQISMITCVSA